MANGQTGSAIKYAFERLGHEVIAVDAKLAWRNSYAISLRVKPDLVFCSRTQVLTDQIFKIKTAFPNTITCMWNVDTRERIDKWRHLFPLIKAVDYYFVVDYNFLEQWRNLNPSTYWLPQGLQNEIYDKPKEITEDDRKKYSCDICFAGSRTGVHRLYRANFLDAIEQMDVDFKQWGCRDNVQVFNEEHNKAVALSKINIGCSNYPKSGKCVSVRNYKILGAGGFLLTDYGDGLEKLFPCGENEKVLDYCKTYKEVAEKVKYWLSHENERKAVAERGYRWVHAHARYQDRMEIALNYMRDRL